MKVVVDTEVCIGCETCTEICPEVFRMDDEAEKAQVKIPESESIECVAEAIEACPVSCIHWVE